MSPRSHRFALLQMVVRPGDLAANLSRAERLIGQAAAEGADLVLLPECFDLGWCDPSAREHAGTIRDGAAPSMLRRMARKHRLHVCGGITERRGDRIHNAAVLIDPRGNLLLHHRKIHELKIAEPLYARGDRLGVMETDLGILGVMICADGFATDLAISRALAQMGAQVILSPSAWVVPSDHDNAVEPYGDLWRDSYCPIAREFGCAILAASNVGFVGGGEWQGRPCIGCSLVIGPDGEDVLQGPYGPDAECVLLVDRDDDDCSIRQATPGG